MRSLLATVGLSLVGLAPSSLASAQALDAVFRHPSGFHFAHPSSWLQQPLNDSVLALVPSDVRRHEGQPAEILLVAGEEAPGATDALDSEVIELADRFVGAVLPFVQRSTEPTRFLVAGSTAAQLHYAGTSPTGLDAEAALWVRLMNGSAVALLVAGPSDAFASRQSTARQIFESFGYEAPQGDARLVGTWRHSRTYMSGEFSMIEQNTLVLRADGTFTDRSQLMGGLQSSDDSGLYAGDANASSQNASTGRWGTANKRITLEWGGGATERWEYLISDKDLMFRSGSSKKLWVRVE